MTSRLPENRILYEINVRQWLTEHGVASMTDVPDAALDQLRERGVDLVWLMGVWQSGPRALELARTYPDLQPVYRAALPDFSEDDVIASPYSIAAYVAASDIGGPYALAHLRKRLASRGMRLILDFVVNQTGVDHPWVEHRPELYVSGSEDDLAREPDDFFRAGKAIIAHGRDPYFPAWTDSAQLDLLLPATREQLRAVIASVAEQCDGVRCDMSMLALRSVFEQIWGERTGERPRAEGELWPELIDAARGRNAGFLFIAEVYWRKEAELRGLGFDYVYDKELYDTLVQGHPRDRISGDERLVRFLENHDEPRAASVLPADRHRAAATIAGTLPGLFLVHDGQVEGRKTRTPIQLRRRAQEPRDEELAAFYERLLHLLRDPLFRRGTWRKVGTREAWPGNPTWENFVAYEWRLDERRAWIVIHFAPHQGQCLAAFESDRTVMLRDLLSGEQFVRDVGGGLYVDLPAYGVHLFDVR